MTFKPPSELYKDILPLCENETLLGVGAPVSYHFAECFIACRRAALFKNAVLAWCERKGVKVELNKQKSLSKTSDDALGKALMVGFEKHSPEASITEYRRLTSDNVVGTFIDNDRLEQEIVSRLNILENKLKEYTRYETVEPEVSMSYTAVNGVTYTGKADAVVTGPAGRFVIEIKNTNNAGWVIKNSGQVDYYCRLLNKTGNKVDGGFYFLFPGWFDKDKNMIHATDIAVHAPTKNADDYIQALYKLSKLPLNINDWYITDKAGESWFGKCKTCQCRFDCQKELGKKIF